MKLGSFLNFFMPAPCPLTYNPGRLLGRPCVCLGHRKLFLLLFMLLTVWNCSACH